MSETGHPVPVSVVIPCYRCGSTIARAIASVTAQTFSPTEVIVVDDASNDDTVATLEQLIRSTPNMRVLRLARNGGPGAARNAGWEEARNPYIAFLDADDAWHPRKLELQYTWMANNPEVALTGHDSVIVRAGATIPALPARWRARPVQPWRLLVATQFPTRSVMLRRELPFRFPPDKRYSEDFLLWVRIVFGGYKSARLPLPLAHSFKRDFGAGGLSGDLWRMERGALDSYYRAYREGYITVFALAMISTLSIGKFVARLLRYGMSRAAGIG